MTIRVKKAYIGRADYDVLLEVSDSSIPKFDEGSGIFPIWAIVAISVILMVITVAASIVYLHRRRRRVSVYSACWRRRTGTIEQTGDVDLVQL
ncbi:MAG: hypothetical protein ABW185_06720 [Sedimenticola sp.]